MTVAVTVSVSFSVVVNVSVIVNIWLAGIGVTINLLSLDELGAGAPVGSGPNPDSVTVGARVVPVGSGMGGCAAVFVVDAGGEGGIVEPGG